MAYKNLFILDTEDLNPIEMLRRIDLAKQNNKDRIAIEQKDGSIVKIKFKNKYKEYCDLECGILD